jgi:hypothetical protein
MNEASSLTWVRKLRTRPLAGNAGSDGTINAGITVADVISAYRAVSIGPIFARQKVHSGAIWCARSTPEAEIAKLKKMVLALVIAPNISIRLTELYLSNRQPNNHMIENEWPRPARLTTIVTFVATRYGRIATLFLLNFGAAKLAVFAGPLVLARLLDPTTYGQIEFGLSVATFMAGVLGLGIPGALPQMTLLRRTMPMIDILAASVAVPGVLCLVGVASAFVVVGSSWAIPAFALSCAVLVLAQGALSIYCRTHSKRSLAAWADGTGNLIIVAIGLMALGMGLPTMSAITAGAVLGALVVVAGAFAVLARMRRPAIVQRFGATIRFGAPVLFQSLAIVWCVVSGRIYLGSFLDPQAVALYGAGLRIASVLLIVHTVLAIALFARLYAMRTRQYDRVLSVYFLFLSFIALTMMLAFPFFAAHISLRAIRSVPEAVTLFPVILVQVFAWGCLASLELRVARARRAGHAAIGITAAAIVFGTVTVLMALCSILTVDFVAWLSALQMIACVLIQFTVLWRRGLAMPRTLFAFVCGVAVMGCGALIEHALRQ